MSSNILTKKERKKISNYFNNQIGQNYPCSNQIVCCGFVTGNDKKWKSFIEKNKENIYILTKRSFILKNQEKWFRIPLNNSIRGFRYYKIKIDKNINKKFLKENILPCCGHYCCDFEWI